MAARSGKGLRVRPSERICHSISSEKEPGWGVEVKVQGLGLPIMRERRVGKRGAREQTRSTFSAVKANRMPASKMPPHESICVCVCVCVCVCASIHGCLISAAILYASLGLRMSYTLTEQYSLYTLTEQYSLHH